MRNFCWRIRKMGRGKMIRVGQGFDVHQLVEGRPCIIGGVTIPYEKGLLGIPMQTSCFIR